MKFTSDKDLVLKMPVTEESKVKQEKNSYQAANIPVAKVIRRRQEYMIDGLGKIVELIIIGETPEGEKAIEYEGFTLIGVQHDGQMAQFPVEFPIDANTLSEAADRFEFAATAQFEKNMEAAREQAEAEQNKIQIARAMPGVPNMRIRD